MIEGTELISPLPKFVLFKHRDAIAGIPYSFIYGCCVMVTRHFEFIFILVLQKEK